jgi:hypothetical protein
MPDPALQPILAPDLRRVTAADGTRRFELSGDELIEAVAAWAAASLAQEKK